MRDLAEVRRFWPKAAEIDFCGPLYVARPVRRHELTIAESLGGGWFLSDWRDGGPELSAVYRGPTIAAAMAAAGFGKRKPGPYAMHNRGMADVARAWQKGPWKGYDRVPHVTRQRPRKRARLGGKARRLACWMAIYRNSSLVTAAQVRASY
jgi:hypothetical protein